MTQPDRETLPEPPDKLEPLFGPPAETYPPLERPGFDPKLKVVDIVTIETIAEEPPVSVAREAELLGSVASESAVGKLLGERFVGIGVRVVPIRRGPDLWFALYYSYSNEVAVEVAISPKGKVLDVVERHFQPAFVAAEIELAIRLAREALGDKVVELKAGVIGIEPPAGSANAWRRLADVRFFRPTERLPRYRATVDLAEEAVIDSGRVPAGRRRNG